MNSLGKTVLYIFLGIGLIVLVVSLATGGGLWIESWSRPAAEQIRTDTFRESQSFVEGTTKELRRYRLEYMKADSENHKDMLAKMAVTEADKVDERHLPEDLKDWVKDMEKRVSE